MKVLMQGRYGLLSGPGGDRIQVENTAEELRKLGVEVDIADTDVKDLSKYDLVHVFQLDWTPETHFYIKHAKEAGKKVVFSPIHHSVKEVERFDKEYVFDYRFFAKYLFSEQHQRDTFKNVYRSLFSLKKSLPTFKSVFKGLKNMHIESLKMSDYVLVQTESEACDLKETYGVDIKYKIVPNGVGTQFFEQNFENKLDIEGYVIAVGRIEPRKNQLKIIEAVEQLRKELNKDIKLVLIGLKTTSNHFTYNVLFQNKLKLFSWIKYIQKVPNKEIASYFHFAKVAVSASWFETSGLTLFEALFSGANIVAAGSRSKEIFGDLASYCDAGDVESIKNAIKKEFLSPKKTVPDSLKEEYTWTNAAKKTLEVYEYLEGNI